MPFAYSNSSLTRGARVEAKAIILGQSDLYVKMGSKINLTCVISQGPHDLGTISWHRGECLIYAKGFMCALRTPLPLYLSVFTVC
jgi:hypothetical protein